MSTTPPPQLLKAYEQVPDLYLILSPELTVLTASDAYLAATFTVREKIVGKYLFDVFPENPAARGANGTKNLRHSLQQVLLTKRPHRMALQHYDVPHPAQPGGFAEKYWLPLNTPVLSEEGEVAYIIHKVEDVTEWIKSEQELKDSNELLQTTVDSSLDMIQVFKAVRDENGEIIDFKWILNNQTSENIYGDVIWESLLEKNPGVVETGIFDTFRRVVETGIPDQSERHYVHEQFDGWFYQSAVKLDDGVATTTRDITERKKSEQEILRLKDEVAKKATDKYSSLFNSIDQGFCIIELLYDEKGKAVDYRWLEANPKYEKHSGIINPVGKLGSEIIPTTENYWLENYEKVLKTGKASRFENWHEATGRWYQTYASRIGDNSSRQIAVVFEDITERRQREQQQSFLIKLGDALRPLSDGMEVQRVAMRVLGEHLNVDRAIYAEINMDEDWFEATDNYTSQSVQKVTGRFPFTAFGPPGEKLKKGESLIIHDVTAEVDEDSKRSFYSMDVHAVVAVPLIKQGKLIADLSVHQTTPRHWLQHEVALIKETAERTWAAVGRAKAEQALRESEVRFRNLVESYAQAIWEATATGEVVVDSPSWRAYTGQTVEEWLGYGWVNAIHPDDRTYAKRQWRKAVASKSLVDAHFRLKHATSGVYRWTNVRATPILDESGNITKWAGMNIDIHEQKKAEEVLANYNTLLEQEAAERTVALQESNDLLESVLENTSSSIMALSSVRDEQGELIDSEYLLTNSNLLSSVHRESLTGKRFVEEFPGVVASGLFARYKEVADTGVGWSDEVHVDYDSMDTWAQVFVTKLLDGVLVTYFDISDRKKAEEELLKQYHVLRQAEEVARMGSWEYNVSNGAFHWSEGMYKLFGLPVGSPVSLQTYLNFAIEEDEPIAKRIVQYLQTGRESFKETLRIKVKDEVLTLKIKAALTHDAQGLPSRMLGVDMDISALKKLEKENLELRLAQQKQLLITILEAQEEERRWISEALHNGVGQLLYAAKIHLGRYRSQEQPDKPNVGSALTQADQILEQAITETRSLSHELTPLVLEQFGLEMAIKEICTSLSTKELHLQCHIAQLPQNLDRHVNIALYRIAQELLTNIIKHAKATQASLQLQKQKDMLVLQVQDNGQGFDAKQLSAGGMGLNAVKDRVKLLNGSIRVSSKPGNGALIRITLPFHS